MHSKSEIILTCFCTFRLIYHPWKIIQNQFVINTLTKIFYQYIYQNKIDQRYQLLILITYWTTHKEDTGTFTNSNLTFSLQSYVTLYTLQNKKIQTELLTINWMYLEIKLPTHSTWSGHILCLSCQSVKDFWTTL